MLCSLLFLILVALATLQSAQCEIYRLSKNVKPVRYNLTMEPLIEEGKFQGSVVIEIDILESTNNVTFHKDEFHIDANDVQIVDSSGKTVKLMNISEKTEAQTCTVIAQDVLLKNNRYNLTINRFSKEFGKNTGFFLKNAYEPKLKSHTTIVVTHFEPTDARKVFPCFDEPGLKATFVINLIRKEGYQSASNEVLVNTKDLGNGRFMDTFKETPKMSTYVVAFTVTNFTFTETIGKHRFLAAPRALASGKLDYVLHVGVKTLKALEDYLGLDYLLTKIDQVAVPNFRFRGMENWGLINYNEAIILKTNTTDAEDLQNMNLYVAHEFAHQWFGNLVTAEWWDYLWLSEALSTYFHYHIAAFVEPSWRLKEQFVVAMLHEALLGEERGGGKPLNYPTKISGEYAPFHILYQKGSSIVRMVEHFLTEDVFKRGLHIYLQNNKLSSVVPSDLYRALQESVAEAGANHLLGNMTVADILTTWDSKAGFPIVTAIRNYETGSITLQQQPSIDAPWIIPVNFAFSSDKKLNFSNTTADYWFAKGKVTLDDGFPTDGCLIINKLQTGYYRVNYDAENWNRIIDYMNSDNFTSIPPINRAQLLDDAFNLASKNVIPWDIPLRLGEYLMRERDYIPFVAFHKAINNHIRINRFRKADKDYKYFKNYTLPNIVFNTYTEYEVYEEYLKTTLRGIKDYLESLEETKKTHIDELSLLEYEKYQLFRKYNG